MFNIFAVRYRHGVSKAAAFASLQRSFGKTVLKQLPAEDVVNLQSVDHLPLLLAGLMALFGVMTLGNTLVISVRRRRRDFTSCERSASCARRSPLSWPGRPRP